jgi:hypothetical protein
MWHFVSWEGRREGGRGREGEGKRGTRATDLMLFSDPDSWSYGPDFNDNGGGVWAMQWESSGISPLSSLLSPLSSLLSPLSSLLSSPPSFLSRSSLPPSLPPYLLNCLIKVCIFGSGRATGFQRTSRTTSLIPLLGELPVAGTIPLYSSLSPSSPLASSPLPFRYISLGLLSTHTSRPTVYSLHLLSSNPLSPLPHL